MKLQRQISYLMPEGSFPGTILNCSLYKPIKGGKITDNLRFNLRSDPLPGEPLYDYRARCDFWGDNNEELLTTLYRLLGGDVVLLTDEEGTLLPERLELLEGTRVMFDVTHEVKPGYVTPFRRVSNLRLLTPIHGPQ